MQQRFIQLEGDQFAAMHDGADLYLPVRPVCDRLGIDWRSQHRKLTRAAGPCGGPGLALDIPTPGGVQTMLCLPSQMFLAWLRGLQPSRIGDAARARLTAYLAGFPVAIEIAAQSFDERCARRDRLLKRSDVRKIMRYSDRGFLRAEIAALMGGSALIDAIWPEIEALGLFAAPAPPSAARG